MENNRDTNVIDNLFIIRYHLGMVVAEQISDKVHKLPMASQKKVLHFVELLLDKNGGQTEEDEWSDFSFAQAMRGLETDDMPEYTDDDLKERWQ